MFRSRVFLAFCIMGAPLGVSPMLYSSPGSQRSQLAFMHIPKCAGSSFMAGCVTMTNSSRVGRCLLLRHRVQELGWCTVLSALAWLAQITSLHEVHNSVARLPTVMRRQRETGSSRAHTCPAAGSLTAPRTLPLARPIKQVLGAARIGFPVRLVTHSRSCSWDRREAFNLRQCPMLCHCNGNGVNASGFCFAAVGPR